MSSATRTLALTAVLNSLVFDFITRARLAGLHLDYHVLEQNPLPSLSLTREYDAIVALGAALNLSSPWLAPQQLQLRDGEIPTIVAAGSSMTDAERTRRLVILNSLIAAMYRLNRSDVRRIIEDCDLPGETLRTLRETAGLDPKGFWRVDKNKPPELRHTVLTVIAFQDLETKIQAAGDRDKGIEAFLTQDHGEGWMLPETLRLADYGLGHDERAKKPQPVAGNLGPRFYDWQLVQSADESWRGCNLHARNLLGAHGYAMLLVDLIERRVAKGEDYLRLLTDSLTHKLAGRDGYVTILLEIRARQVFTTTPTGPWSPTSGTTITLTRTATFNSSTNSTAKGSSTTSSTAAGAEATLPHRRTNR